MSTAAASENDAPRPGRVHLTEHEREGFGIRARDIDGDDFVYLESDVERIVTARLRDAARAGADVETGARLGEIARAICDSEAFMWLMVGANHPEAHLHVLRQAWSGHYLPNGGGYGAATRTAPAGGENSRG